MTPQEMIRKDLIELEPYSFYLKHIVKSHNWYFSEYLHIPPDEIVDRMDYFKEIVSSKLDINFHSLQIVGSAKTGYSLSPSPKKLLKPFHDETPGTPSSDIDIAIISDRLYHHFWSELRKVNGIIYRQIYFTRLSSSIFRGFINEKDLTSINEMDKEWEGLISPINKQLQDDLGFVHPITYRVYRSWEDLQEYQLSGISKAMRALEGEQNV